MLDRLVPEGYETYARLEGLDPLSYFQWINQTDQNDLTDVSMEGSGSSSIFGRLFGIFRISK